MAEYKAVIEKVGQLAAEYVPGREAIAQQALRDCAESIHAHLNQIGSLERVFERVRWRAVQESWKWLEQSIRVRRVEADLSWFEIGAQVQLGGSIDGDNPTDALFAGIRLDEASESMVTTIGQLPSHLAWLAEQNIDVIEGQILQRVQYPRVRGHTIEGWFEQVRTGHRRWRVIKTYAEKTDPETLRPRTRQ